MRKHDGAISLAHTGDEQTSIGIVHAYLDAGHNFIDTASVYAGRARRRSSARL
jgi:aryl-alcohol dehydrogenase-like predicted oxidoreductase